MTMRHVFTLLILALALSCTDGSGPGLTLNSDAALAAQLDTIDAAFASPQLKSLSRLSLALLSDGITVKTMDTSMLGHTVEWDPIHDQEIFTDRTGAPANALRVMLYVLDSTGRPVYPRDEIGWVDLVPVNRFNGGGPNTMSLRYAVFQSTHQSPSVVADWTVTRIPGDTACGQCATISGVVNAGTHFISFTIPYYIPLNADGNFAGVFTAAGREFAHGATLPGPTSSVATARMAFSFGGDSITVISGPLQPHAAELDGEAEVTVNGKHFATVRRTAGAITITEPGLSAATRRALSGLFAVPADIADYVEWPTFVIFFCGC